MARYIDADKAKHEFNIGFGGVSHAVIANQIIDSVPSADVEEVKHAKWEINCDGYYPFCSNCKTEPKNGVMSKRCPECGAKMDSQL